MQHKVKNICESKKCQFQAVVNELNFYVNQSIYKIWFSLDTSGYFSK